MKIKQIVNTAVLLVILMPCTSQACATCFGAADAAAIRGMNWAIFTLLGVILSLMAGVVTILFKMNRTSRLSAIYEES